ncbi:hypothetical protein JDN41_11410, partial [Rhodomicrobium udaipurense]|nr:hypothetical protein [Rhodomicrobium udaipurense]
IRRRRNEAHGDVGRPKVIRQFIEYLRDTYADDYTDDAPQKALDRYWNRF